MALKLGDKVPRFISKNANGIDFDSDSFIGKKPVVIYFYPKDNTAICTAQACSFRDKYEDFMMLGAEVIGISSDSVSSHKGFAKQYNLPFILLSDYDKKIRTMFGVPTALLGLLPGRVTYVIDKKGIVIMIFNSIKGEIHIAKSLDCLKNLSE